MIMCTRPIFLYFLTLDSASPCVVNGLHVFLTQNYLTDPPTFCRFPNHFQVFQKLIFWLENLHDKNVKQGEKVENKQLESYKIKHNENEATQLAGN